MWTCYNGNINQVWNSGYMVNQLPQTSQEGQYGYNNCGSGSSQDSNCQTAWIKCALKIFYIHLRTDWLIRVSSSADDFCVFAPRMCSRPDVFRIQALTSCNSISIKHWRLGAHYCRLLHQVRPRHSRDP